MGNCSCCQNNLKDENRNKNQRARNNLNKNLTKDMIYAAEINLKVRKQEETFYEAKKFSEDFIQESSNKPDNPSGSENNQLESNKKIYGKQEKTNSFPYAFISFCENGYQKITKFSLKSKKKLEELDITSKNKICFTISCNEERLYVIRNCPNK